MKKVISLYFEVQGYIISRNSFSELEMENWLNNFRTVYSLTESFHVEGLHAIFEVWSQYKSISFHSSNFQVHIHILKKNDLIMVHQRFRRNGDYELHRNISVHSLKEIDAGQEVTLAQLRSDIKLTHKGKHIKVCLLCIYLNTQYFIRRLNFPWLS